MHTVHVHTCKSDSREKHSTMMYVPSSEHTYMYMYVITMHTKINEGKSVHTCT